MVRRVNITYYNIGLVFKNNKLENILKAGIHWIYGNKQIIVFSTLVEFEAPQEIDLLLENKQLKELLMVYEVEENQLLVVKHGTKIEKVLSYGKYAFWKNSLSRTFDIIDTDHYKVSTKFSRTIVEKSELNNYVQKAEVSEHEKGLLFVNEELVEVLNSGIHLFWKNGAKIEINKVEIRHQLLELAGQEILTADKANIRLNFNVIYQVIDVEKALIEHKDFIKQLYNDVQIQVRRYIGKLTLDELLETKDSIGQFVINELKINTNSLGIKLHGAGIKDIILPGDVKEIMNKVLIAQKQAHANMITRREETATTRSLLNTAKLMENNQMLFKLKEMEYVERISEKIGEITVSGNGKVIDQLTHLFSKQ